MKLTVNITPDTIRESLRQIREVKAAQITNKDYLSCCPIAVALQPQFPKVRVGRKNINLKGGNTSPIFNDPCVIPLPPSAERFVFKFDSTSGMGEDDPFVINLAPLHFDIEIPDDAQELCNAK